MYIYDSLDEAYFIILQRHFMNSLPISFFFSVRRLISNGILTQIFPLHDPEELKKLKHTWYSKVKISYQPLGKLHDHGDVFR